MKRLFIILTLLFCYFLSHGQAYGFLEVKFVDDGNSIYKFDSIYGADIRNSIEKYLEKQASYPQKMLENCEEGIVIIGFEINKIDCSIDESTIKIISGTSSDFDNTALHDVQNMPQISRPYNYNYCSDQNLSFAISINYKILDCDDPIWRNDKFPENGQYTGYYKKGNKKRVEGFYKNGRPDSLWTFYNYEGNILQRGYCAICRYQLDYIHIIGVSIIDEFDGIKNGKWEYYDDNGKLFATKQYLCGVSFGSHIYYDSLGIIKDQYFYNNDFDYIHYVYDSAGNIVQIRSMERRICFYHRFMTFLHRLIKKGYGYMPLYKEKIIDFTYYDNRAIETKLISYFKARYESEDKERIEHWKYNTDGTPEKYSKSKNGKIIKEKKY
jgi:hypothetical protein